MNLKESEDIDVHNVYSKGGGDILEQICSLTKRLVISTVYTFLGKKYASKFGVFF